MGSHLCDMLIEKGYTVVCVDNLLTGNESNIKHLLGNKSFEYKNLDVMDLAGIDTSKVDFVYHMASPASPNHHSQKSYHALAFETMAVNSKGTWVAAQFALDNGAKFLFASTSEVYGDPLEHPQRETYRGNVSTTGPRSVYDESKRFGETITASFVRDKGLDGRIVRIFNTYGPRMAKDDGRVVIEFVSRALKNEGLPIFGDGKQTRSFCYVSDLVDGVVKGMEASKTKGEIFNLGNPNEFTILHLAWVVKEITSSSSDLEFEENLPEDDPLRRCPDIEKARKVLGWEPEIELEEGLKKLVDFMEH